MRRSLPAALLALLLSCRNVEVNNPPPAPAAPLAVAGTRTDSVCIVRVVVPPDVDTDDVCVRLDFGDGVTSDWSGFAAAGDTAAFPHSFPAGTFMTRAQACDSCGALSDWSAGTALAVRPLPPFPNQQVGTVDLAYESNYLGPVVTPDGRYLFVAGDEGLTRVSTDGAEVRSLPGVSGPLALSPDGGSLYVAVRDTLVVLRTEDLAVTRKQVAGWQAEAICLSPDGGSMYVVARHRAAPADVRVLRCSDLGEVATVAVEHLGTVIEPGPDGRHVYVETSEGLVSIRTSDPAVEERLDLPDMGDFAVAPTGDVLYASGGAAPIRIVSTDGLRVVDSIPLTSAWGVTFSLDGSFAAVVVDDDLLHVISTGMKQVLATIEFDGCECTTAPAALPDFSRVYVVVHEQVFVFGPGD